MAESGVVKQVRDFQAALLDSETQQFAEMGKRWMEMEQKLEAQFMALALEIEELRLNGQQPSAEKIRGMRRLGALLGQAREETDKYAAYASDLIEKRKLEIAASSWEQAAKTLEAAGLGRGTVKGVFDRFPKKDFENMAGLMADGSPLRKYLDGVYGDSVNGMVSALMQATGQGWNPRKTARAMRDGLGLGLERVLRVARTEQMRAMREATRMGYGAAGVDYYKRIASKSARTCIACLLEDGKLYPVKMPFEEHPQGRCSMVPCVDGQPDPVWETGEEWFLKQAEETQKSVLGAGLYAKWKGGVPLSEFVQRKRSDLFGGSFVASSQIDILKTGKYSEAFSIGDLAKAIGAGKYQASSEDIARIRAEVGQAGFSDVKEVLVKAKYDGYVVDGVRYDLLPHKIRGLPDLLPHKIRGLPRSKSTGDLVSNGVAHYMKHVIERKEWPEGTSYNQYLDDLRRIVEDPGSRILFGKQEEKINVFFTGKAGWMADDQYLLVIFRPSYGKLVTGFVPDDALEIYVKDNVKDPRWIK